jgi:hypothetical protein
VPSIGSSTHVSPFRLGTAQDAVQRATLCQNVAHRLFRGAVGHGYRVKARAALVVGVQAGSAEMPERDGPGGIGKRMRHRNQIRRVMGRGRRHLLLRAALLAIGR